MRLVMTAPAAKKSKTIRALRQASLACGEPVSLANARAAAEAAGDDDRPVIVAVHIEDEELQANALAVLLDAGCEAEWQDDTTPKPQPEVEGESEDGPNPHEGHIADRCAMLLMHTLDGHPGAALQLGAALYRVTRDPLWEEVCTSLLMTFPPVYPQEADE